MARDVLAMPVSMVAYEFAFSTGHRVLDSFRSSLTPRIVEALIGTQDWLRKSYGPVVLEENLIELEDLENSKLSCSYFLLYLYLRIYSYLLLILLLLLLYVQS